jgi:hypothetical protein
MTRRDPIIKTMAAGEDYDIERSVESEPGEAMRP